MWLAHFYLKSEEEFIEKMVRGIEHYDDNLHHLKLQDFYDLDSKCDLEDNSLKELYLRLKESN